MRRQYRQRRQDMGHCAFTPKMKSPITLGCIALFWSFGAILNAQPPTTIALWPTPFGDRTEIAVPSPKANYTRLSAIDNPSLTVYPAPRDLANGTAVIIAPGGGHKFLSIDLEGSEVAAWFNQRGVTAFVLKYRLSKEPESPYVFADAVADAHQAIQLVRTRATEWDLAVDRIGILGFSAGGQVAGHAAVEFRAPTTRPDFQVLVYGNTDATADLPADTPPAFLICAQDDGNKPAEALTLATRFLAAKIPAELHIYQEGGHAYAMRDYGKPVHRWPDRLADWMRANGWLPRP